MVELLPQIPTQSFTTLYLTQSSYPVSENAQILLKCDISQIFHFLDYSWIACWFQLEVAVCVRFQALKLRSKLVHIGT